MTHNNSLVEREGCAMSDWLPIETHCRDGRTVLVCQNLFGYATGQRRVTTARYCRLNAYHDGTYFDCDSGAPLSFITHWQPLPEPPEAA